MSPSTSTKSKLSGQLLVEAFIEDLKVYLQSQRDRSIKGTTKHVAETIVNGSPRLQGANIDNLARQLCMAVGARCRQPVGLKFERFGDEVKVVLV